MKKHTITSLLLCFVLTLSCFALFGCADTKGYVLSEDQTYYVFEGYEDFDGTEITILSEIKGLPVKEIAKNAFADNQTLTTVTIPDSVTKIGYGAFSKCAELKEVTIGSGITTIPESAFASSQKLTTVTLSDGVEKISKNAFANCLKLDTINLPSTITTLAEKAFYKCRNLPSVTLPESLTKIEISCFEGCSDLAELTINKGLEEIGNSCFKDCSKLATINFAMDGNLVLIGGSAFLGSAVTELTFPDSLKGIKAAAFFNCKALRKVTFGKNIEFIGGSVSDVAGGAFGEYVSAEDKPTDTAHILEMIFPEDAIGYGWYPSLDGWGSLGSRSFWQEGNPGSYDLYFLTPDEIRNNEARIQLCQSMTGYSWFKCKTPNPEHAV